MEQSSRRLVQIKEVAICEHLEIIRCFKWHQILDLMRILLNCSTGGVRCVIR